MAGAVTGFQAVLKKLDRLATAHKEAVAAAVYQKGLQIITKAKKRVPVDVGVLKSSGYAAPPKSIENPVVDVGFGTNYAIAVHERVEVFHPVGGPLYLKSVVDEARSGWARDVADKAKRNLARGIGVKGVPASEPKAPKE